MAEKYLRVEMPDGSKWDVPARLIAENRARYYAKRDSEEDPSLDHDEVYANEYAYTMRNDDEIEDWAANNMNWSDVAAHAVKVDEPAPEVDYQEGWVNGEKEVIER